MQWLSLGHHAGRTTGDPGEHLAQGPYSASVDSEAETCLSIQFYRDPHKHESEHLF